MRDKLALPFALVVFAALTALGVGMAGAEPSSDAVGLESASSIGTTPSIPSAPPSAPACENGLDDDGDGLVDLEDPGCLSPEQDNEGPAGPPAKSAPSEEEEQAAPGVERGAGLQAAEAKPQGEVEVVRNEG